MNTARSIVVLLMVLVLKHNVARCTAEQRTVEEGVCRSIGGLKFDGQKSMQRSRMEVCSQYRMNTCCNETHMTPLRLKIREPVVAKFKPSCQRLTEEMVCSSCHPYIGTGKIKSICRRVCDAWYHACQYEYYSYSGSGTLTPCYGNALVCSPLSTIATSGPEFCKSMGFVVGTENDSEGDECFDGSVPRHLGLAEPTEPWQDIAQRLFEEQSQDPSIIYIVAIFVLLFTMYFGRRLMRDPYALGSGDSGRKELTLEQVRMLQQMRYGGQGGENGEEREYNSDMEDYDSDCSSAIAQEDRSELQEEERNADSIEGSIDTKKDVSC